MDVGALERSTARFYEWELRGRGWRSYAHRVPLEPVFVLFPGYRQIPSVVIDDARKPSFLSRLFAPRPQLALPAGDEIEANEDPPEASVDGIPHQAFEILVPPGEKIDPQVVASCVRSLRDFGALCFELVGRDGHVAIRFAGGTDATEALGAQLQAFFPAATIREPEDDLVSLWAASEGENCFVLEFGLGREFMLPLREVRANPDPLTPLVGALCGAKDGDLALLQVLFEPVRELWAESAGRALITSDGTPFFVDSPELTDLGEEKLSSPLYAVVIRALVRADDGVTAGDLIARIAGALNQYSAPDRNCFVPLASENLEELTRDILTRSTHRSGMLLSLDELCSIVRLPGEHLRSPALLREVIVEPSLPQAALSREGVVIGEAKHRSAIQPVRLPLEVRLQHAHIVGASGTGKSTLLENLILQDILEGRGVGIIDPHGDLADAILARIPDERVDDVILFDPSDDEGIVGWNILGAHSQIEKELLASDLVSVFQRLSTAWGDQMGALLANAVLAFLESSQGGTLVELRKFLLDDSFREGFLATVRDDHVVSFWREEYPLLIGKKPQAPILTRLDTFLRSKLIRERVTEREKPLNFRDIIDSGRIFLGKLSQGAIGDENAALLGSLIVSKFHQVSLSRQNVAREQRRPFFLYIDEIQQVAVSSMAGLFSGVRKYNLAVTIAHQDLYQLHSSAPELERSALTNAHLRVVFRVSTEDARKLERDMGEFTTDDLTNLGRGQAICRIGKSSDSFRLATLPLPKVEPAEAEQRQLRIRRMSAARWGRPRVAPPSGSVAPGPPVVESRPKPIPAVEAPPPRPPLAEIEAPVPPPMPGRGGAIHKYIQGLISEWARTHGFKPEIESQLAEGGRVDVALTRDELHIACEVAGTTTIENEIGNLNKCLEAGFTHVCAVSLDRPFLRRLEAAVSDQIDEADRERVHLFSPEELLAFLGVQMMTRSEERIAGYRVETRRTVDVHDVQDRKRAVAEIMLKSVRRMREKK